MLKKDAGIGLDELVLVTVPRDEPAEQYTGSQGALPMGVVMSYYGKPDDPLTHINNLFCRFRSKRRLTEAASED